MKSYSLKILALSCYAISIGSLSFSQEPPAESKQIPIVTRAVVPYYPSLPSGGREAGDVTVSLGFDPEGKLARVESSGGSLGLRRESEASAREWTFEGNSRDVTIRFSFRLVDKGVKLCRAAITLGSSLQVEVCETKKKVVTISDPPMVNLGKTPK